MARMDQPGHRVDLIPGPIFDGPATPSFRNFFSKGLIIS